MNKNKRGKTNFMSNTLICDNLIFNTTLSPSIVVPDDNGAGFYQMGVNVEFYFQQGDSHLKLTIVNNITDPYYINEKAIIIENPDLSIPTGVLQGRGGEIGR